MVKKASVLALVIIMMSGIAARAGGGLRIVELGVKGGLSSQSVKFVDAGKHSQYNLSANSKVGYHLGLISRVNLPLFHIQTEMLYNHNAYDLNVVNKAGTSFSKSKVKINTLELPVLFGLRMLWFRFQIGPQFNLMTETKFSNAGTVTDVDVSKSTMSFVTGIGFDIGKLNLDVRYNGQFSRPRQSVLVENKTPGVDYRSKMRKWMFSVGYVF